MTGDVSFGGCGAVTGAVATVVGGAGGSSLFCLRRPTTITVVSATNELATTRPSLVSRVICPTSIPGYFTSVPCSRWPAPDGDPQLGAASARVVPDLLLARL